MDTLTGVIADLRVYNGWGRAKLVLPNGSHTTIVGKALADLAEGNAYQVDGRATIHPKFGSQFDVQVVQVSIASSADAIARHIKRNFKGIGEVGIKKMIKHHVDANSLEFLRQQLVSSPHLVDFTPFTKKAVRASDEATMVDFIYRNLATKVGISGVHSSALQQIAEALLPLCEKAKDPVAAAWTRFSENPYVFIQDIDGYGFRQADAIGTHLECPVDDDNRIAALALEALRTGCEGHTFLSLEDVHYFIHALDSRVDAHQAMEAAMRNGKMIVQDGDRYYPGSAYRAETNLAQILAKRAVTIFAPMSPLTGVHLEKKIADAEMLLARSNPKFKLDDSQRAALMGMLSSDQSVHTLTAGPGCGKTALMEILAIVTKGTAIQFCGPTGMSAKVLSKRVKSLGMSAQTIHSTLGVTEDGFEHDEDNPLEAQNLVADETSMDDLQITNALFKALRREGHIILLGDENQLASVGPGNILSDLMVAPGDHHRLTETHRNQGGILKVVNQVGRGIIDCVDYEDVKFWHSLPEHGTPEMEQVIAQYDHAVKNHGIKRVGLLMAKRKGNKETPGWNTTYMNEYLRARVNAHGQPVAGTSFRVGDRILIKKNSRVKQPGKTSEGTDIIEQVVNGDTGTITAFGMKENGTTLDVLALELDDGRHIEYPGTKVMSDMDLAYAKTVHSSQGSEYDEVLFVCTNGPPSFMHRGIVFTALSRAKSMLHVIGEDRVLRRIVKNPIPPRNSMLVERVAAEIKALSSTSQRNVTQLLAEIGSRAAARSAKRANATPAFRAAPVYRNPSALPQNADLQYANMESADRNEDRDIDVGQYDLAEQDVGDLPSWLDEQPRQEVLVPALPVPTPVKKHVLANPAMHLEALQRAIQNNNAPAEIEEEADEEEVGETRDMFSGYS